MLKNLQNGKGGKTGFNLNAANEQGAMVQQGGNQQGGGQSGEQKGPPPVDGIPVSAVNSKREGKNENEVP